MSCNYIETLIDQAIGTGMIVGITYEGGSDPGSYRDIQPNKRTEKMVWAYCHTSRAVKQFSIAKISKAVTVPTESDTSNLWTNEPAKPKYSSIYDFYEISKGKFENAGFAVKFSGDDDWQCFSLTSYFKNGNLRKRADHMLSYEKWSFILVADQNGDVSEEIIGERDKPFCIRSKACPVSPTFSILDNAINRFEEMVGC